MIVTHQPSMSVNICDSRRPQTKYFQQGLGTIYATVQSPHKAAFKSHITLCGRSRKVDIHIVPNGDIANPGVKRSWSCLLRGDSESLGRWSYLSKLRREHNSGLWSYPSEASGGSSCRPGAGACYKKKGWGTGFIQPSLFREGSVKTWLQPTATWWKNTRENRA